MAQNLPFLIRDQTHYRKIIFKCSKIILFTKAPVQSRIDIAGQWREDCFLDLNRADERRRVAKRT